VEKIQIKDALIVNGGNITAGEVLKEGELIADIGTIKITGTNFFDDLINVYLFTGKIRGQFAWALGGQFDWRT